MALKTDCIRSENSEMKKAKIKPNTPKLKMQKCRNGKVEKIKTQIWRFPKKSILKSKAHVKEKHKTQNQIQI